MDTSDVLTILEVRSKKNCGRVERVLMCVGVWGVCGRVGCVWACGTCVDVCGTCVDVCGRVGRVLMCVGVWGVC